MTTETERSSTPKKKTIEFPYPPSLNNYWVERVIVPKNGKRPFVSVAVGRRGKEFREQVRAAFVERFGKRFRPIESRLAVEIKLFAPDRRRRDLDNAIKALFDSITSAGVWLDDSQVDRLTVIRGPVEPPGKLIVLIEEIVEPQRELF